MVRLLRQCATLVALTGGGATTIVGSGKAGSLGGVSRKQGVHSSMVGHQAACAEQGMVQVVSARMRIARALTVHFEVELGVAERSKSAAEAAEGVRPMTSCSCRRGLLWSSRSLTGSGYV